jgi:Family of unknown function (DUF5362)
MSDADSLSPSPEGPLARIPFGPRAEASLRALCNWMQIAAVISIVGAVFKVVSAFTPRHDLSKLVDAVITFLIGLWIYQAGTAFRKVVATDTADQRHLMEGFTLLRRVFLLQSILVIIVLAFLVIALIVGVLVFAARGTG